MVSAPQDLDLSSNSWNILVDDGTIKNPQFQTVQATSFAVPQLSGGPPLRVFVVGNLKLGNVNIIGAANGTGSGVVFLASGDVTISGTVTLSTLVGSTHVAACRGTSGYTSHAQANGACYEVPPGGGGAAGPGAAGGRILDGSGTSTGLAGGPASGSDDLQPLVGGCSGGGFNNSDQGQSYVEGSYGGGAIQISSRKSITINGKLLADGDRGGEDQGQDCEDSLFGAGGGGGILLEAPTITLGPNSQVSAAGGDGFGCNPAQSTCGLPGKGGTGAAAATNGGDVNFTTALGSSAVYQAGGGGGSVGRIRINTPTGSYTQDATAVKNASLTTGSLKTR